MEMYRILYLYDPRLQRFGFIPEFNPLEIYDVGPSGVIPHDLLEHNPKFARRNAFEDEILAIGAMLEHRYKRGVLSQREITVVLEGVLMSMKRANPYNEFTNSRFLLEPMEPVDLEESGTLFEIVRDAALTASRDTFSLTNPTWSGAIEIPDQVLRKGVQTLLIKGQEAFKERFKKVDNIKIVYCFYDQIARDLEALSRSKHFAEFRGNHQRDSVINIRVTLDWEEIDCKVELL